MNAGNNIGNMISSHGPLRIEAPSFGEGMSDDDLSDDGSEILSSFKMRLESQKKQDSKKKKSKA